MRNTIRTIFQYQNRILFFLSCLISVSASLFFYFHGNQNLADYDAIARLNIARKMIDSMTPGIGQLGGIWLPFPQILLVAFVWNDFLWHSGIAGSIISGSAFLFGAIFLQKTAKLILKNNKVSILVWLMFVTNVNILLLQSMAMSESFFLFSLIMTLYFLTKWTIYHSHSDLLLCALFVLCITLTRYEGYFVFIGATTTVFVEAMIRYWKKEGFAKVEGVVLLFLSVAAYGIFLWCLYCALFYKDPLYWLHLYAGSKRQVSTALQSVASMTITKENVVKKSFFTAFLTYSEATLWTNGILIVLLGLYGFILLIRTLLEKILLKERISIYLPLAFISVILFSFLVYGYLRGFIPEIEYPPITIEHLLSKSFNDYSHSNIRYGIIMAPLIILLAGFVASRNTFLFCVVILVFCLQIFTNIWTPLFLQFSFPKSWGYSTITSIPWFQSHYDEGRILISANSHENFMFQTQLPYKDFIYEGSREYWITSLDNPEKYATWVIYDASLSGDTVNDFLTPHAHTILQKKYILMYDKNKFKIYRLRRLL